VCVATEACVEGEQQYRQKLNVSGNVASQGQQARRNYEKLKVDSPIKKLGTQAMYSERNQNAYTHMRAHTHTHTPQEKKKVGEKKVYVQHPYLLKTRETQGR